MFQDEQILAQRMEAQRLRAITLGTTAAINGEEYVFSPRKLFENQIEMLLPDTFELLSEQAIQVKFMAAQPPQMVLSNEAGNICFALDYSDYELLPEDVDSTLMQMKSAIKRVNPADVFQDEKSLETTHKAKVSYFEFKSYALDADLYNMMFLASMSDKMFIGSFSCPYDEHAQWVDYLKKISCSIKLVDEV